MSHNHGAVTSQHNRIRVAERLGHRVALLNRMDERRIHVFRQGAGTEKGAGVGRSRVKRLVDHRQGGDHVIMEMRDALDIAARLVSPRMHIHLRRRFVFAFDQLAVEIGDHHIVRLDRRAANRMGQDHQMIRAGNACADMAAVIHQSGVK